MIDLSMGGYAYYVWPSYALAAILFTLIPLVLAKQHRTIRDRVRSEHAPDS